MAVPNRTRSGSAPFFNHRDGRDVLKLQQLLTLPGLRVIRPRVPVSNRPRGRRCSSIDELVLKRRRPWLNPSLLET
jgi:hypothetical protein